MKRLLIYFIPVLLFLSGCKKEPVPQKGLNLCYVILDKSSNSYSDLGGNEENYIDLNTAYLRDWINSLYQQINKYPIKNDLILFFNYVDEDSKGNKELYLKIPAFEMLDSIYRPKMGQIESTQEEQAIEFKMKKQNREKEVLLFQKNKEQVLSEIENMLSKSKRAKASDCSGVLLTANQKLGRYLEIKKDKKMKNKIIIAFSDLVNFPINNSPITVDYKIIRPGFTGEVSYLKNNQCINITSQNEFQELLFNLLDN